MGTTMPLSEVPFNHARRNAQLQGHPSEGRLRPQTPNGNDNSSTIQKPSSIQSMLRNTTETGDVGQFSIKPSRVPTAIPRPSPASSSKTRNAPSRLRQPAPYYNGSGGYHGHHTAMPSPNGSSSSRHSQRPFRGPPRVPSFEDYHTFSMTQSSYTSHSLTPRHPYSNGHHHARADLQNIRPRSPFAYPTRLRRPGYRPSSPSLSELNKSHTQRYTGTQRDPSFRTASPSSGHYPTRSPSPWQHGFNQSDPMLHHYPTSIGPGPSRNPSLSSTRPATPKPSSSLRSVASSSQLPRARSVASLSKPRGQHQPPSPMFYDYTEGFDEHDDYTNMSVSTAILFEQSTPEVASNTYSETGESLESTSLAETPLDDGSQKKPTQSKDHEIDKAASRLESIGAGWIRATGHDLSDVLEMSEREAPSDQGEAWPEAGHEDRHITRFENTRRQPAVSTVVETVQNLLPHKTISVVQSRPEFARSVSALVISRASNDNSSPGTGSMVSAKSSPHLEQDFLTPEPVDNPDAALPCYPRTDSSVVDAGPSAVTPAEVHSAIPVDSIRGPSLEDQTRAEPREILSPTPERSITSSIARDRFSKILSIDESLMVLDHTGAANKREQRIDSPMQGFRSGSTIPLSVEHPWRKRSSYFRDNTMHSNSASKVLVEASDSEEEPELTSALRATFCKTDSQIPEHFEKSSIDTLPSQTSMRRPQTPLNIRRTSATRVPITKLPPLQDIIPATPNKDAEAPPQDLAHKVSDVELKRPTLIDKELPPLPRDRLSVVSYSPPAQASPSALPFSFSPLVQKRPEDLTIAELEAVTSSYLAQEVKTTESDESHYTPAKPKALLKRKSAVSLPDTKLKAPSDREYAASPLSSWPWHFDTSYPWDDDIPELDVRLPLGADESSEAVDKTPRFKFRLQRASTFGGGARRRSKRFSTENTSNTFASSDIFPGPSIEGDRIPNLAMFPTNINSSHDVLRSSLQRTRFVRSFEEQSPTAKLMPQSPSQEVHSFFSDDSSIPRPKGSLRKRFSNFKTRTSRVASMDQTQGYDRGLLSSAFGVSRASGRSSRQSARTAGASSRVSRANRARFHVMGKLKMWFQPLEDRVRDWRWRLRYRRDRARAATSTSLYAGV